MVLRYIHLNKCRTGNFISETTRNVDYIDSDWRYLLPNVQGSYSHTRSVNLCAMAQHDKLFLPDQTDARRSSSEVGASKKPSVLVKERDTDGRPETNIAYGSSSIATIPKEFA